jgi:ribonuclease Z
MALEVGFIGVSSAAPGAGEEGACYVVNDSILVDTGFNVAVSLQSLEVAPIAIDHLLFTHCHHDHTLGLPGLLFANRNRRHDRPEAPPLSIYGPLDVTAVRDGALALLQAERYPQVIPEHDVHHIHPGDSLEIGDLRIDVGRAFHAAIGHSYRFTDTLTKGSVVFSGDTSYHEGMVLFARECDVLIHEAAADPAAEVPALQRYLHSRPQDAARVASEAAVSSLALVHYASGQGAAILSKAKEVFPNTRLAKKGQRLQVLGPGQAVWV